MSYFSRQAAKNSINHYSRKDTNHHIKGSDSAANRRTLVIVPFSVVIDDRLGAGRLDTFTTVSDTEMDLNTAANWDSVETDYTVAATRAGKDFYVHACIQVGTVPKILLSANSTYPTGYTANNSRKIGGFHCLCDTIVGVAGSHAAYGFLVGDIVPNSIWDLLFRADSENEGMAYVDGLGWVDMYPPNNSSATSVFGATIYHTLDWYTAVDLGNAAKKRLLRDWEFQKVASGGNEGTSISGGAAPSTVQASVDTSNVSMISTYFIWCLAGERYQWLDESVQMWNWSDGLTGAGHYIDVTHSASPPGVALYLKFSAGKPYLCATFADTADHYLNTRNDDRLPIQYDANANTGIPVYFDYDATIRSRFLINNTLTGTSLYILFPNHPNGYSFKLTHNASAATAGVAVNSDSNILYAVVPSAANGIEDTNIPTQTVSAYVLPGSKGRLWRQGTYGIAKMVAGGNAGATAYCGSRGRSLQYYPWYTDAIITARYMSPGRTRS